VIFTAVYENSGEQIAILSDLHITAETYFTDYETHNTYAKKGKMIHLSEAILQSAADEIISNRKIKTVLIPGDITESGDYDSLVAAADILKKLKDAGKQVFIINGNHDAPSSEDRFPERVTMDKFREIFNDFGYKDAISTDTGSLSYAADIGKKLRLIAIDNTSYFNSDTGEYKEYMDSRLIGWVKGRLDECKSEKKTPIVIMHIPLLNHFPSFLGNLIGEGIIGNDSYKELADTLADNGAGYIFTGHNHGMDIAEYTTSQGNVLYDIETASTVYYPCAYRIIKESRNKLDIRVRDINKLNMDYVSDYNDEEARALIENDFRRYIVEHFKAGLGLEGEISDLTNIGGEIGQLLGLLADGALIPLMKAPLYANDFDSVSIEEIVTANGGVMPESDYSSVEDLAAGFVMAINHGDENIPNDSVEMKLLVIAVKSLFYYINGLSGDIGALYPDINIDIDLELLFNQGKLKVTDSGILALIETVFGSLLPSPLNKMKLDNLDLVINVLPAVIDDMIAGAGTEVVRHMDSEHIYIDSLITGFVAEYLISDMLYDPGDRDRIIKN
jgi:DNA repair exonuclease SbcCD nuclease subunit